MKFSSRILNLLKFAFYYPPFENINETLKNGNTKFNTARVNRRMAISLQLQKEKELVFVSITKKFAALIYNKLETPSEIQVISKLCKLDNNREHKNRRIILTRIVSLFILSIY